MRRQRCGISLAHVREALGEESVEASILSHTKHSIGGWDISFFLYMSIPFFSPILLNYLCSFLLPTNNYWMLHWQGVHGKGSAVSTAPEVLVVTGQAAVGFVFMASAMLLLLFFFMNHIFAVVLVNPLKAGSIASVVSNVHFRWCTLGTRPTRYPLLPICCEPWVPSAVSSRCDAKTSFSCADDVLKSRK